MKQPILKKEKEEEKNDLEMCVMCQHILILNFNSVKTTKAAKPHSYQSKYQEGSFFQVIRMLPWSGTPAKKSQFLAQYKAVNVQKSALFDIEPCTLFAQIVEKKNHNCE